MTKAVHGKAADINVVHEMGISSRDLPVSVVQLTMFCRDLADMDFIGKSDPMVVLNTIKIGAETWREFGRTEVVKNTLNPDFIKQFVIDYYFQERQSLRFDVYDIDSKSPKLEKHDFLGTAECTLGEIVSSRNKSLKMNLMKRDGGLLKGYIVVRADEVQKYKEEITMQWCGKKLDKKDVFGKSDPFLFLHRANEDSSFTPVHKTEVIKNTLDPVWEPFTISASSLCNGNYDTPLRVECYDWNRNGSHKLIGMFDTSVTELSQGCCSANIYECVNEEKKAKLGKKYKHSGIVELMSCTVTPMHTFLDFIHGGCQIHCTIAIDFTSSNEDPRESTSLHYNNPSQPNQYQMAIRAVGDILQDYDSDKLFPALGFGARLPDDSVRYDFSLNGHPTNPFCQGIDGVLEAYAKTLNSVELSGPTNVAPIINHVAKQAGQLEDGNNYFILLIITDGIITDMTQTRKAIIRASSLPLSIIIVGVGNADFGDMTALDADGYLLSEQGRTAERDIVQFVPFNDFVKPDENVVANQACLAREVLAEIPAQFLSYMNSKGFSPKPPTNLHKVYPDL